MISVCSRIRLIWVVAIPYGWFRSQGTGSLSHSFWGFNLKISGKKFNPVEKSLVPDKIMGYKEKMTIIKTDCHPSWDAFLTPDRMSEIREIERAIGEKEAFTPPGDSVLRFLRFDLNGLKVCILGQDPYPQEGAATGRAFEDKRVSGWNKTGRNASLRNILKLLHKYRFNADTVSSLGRVRKDIETGKFNILEPDQLFDHWENQGVLMLNTAFTCKVGSREVSNSHAPYWAGFTHRLLRFIDAEKPECRWFLWGKQAQDYAPILGNPDYHFMSDHPRKNKKKEGSFFHENTFGSVRGIHWINSGC